MDDFASLYMDVIPQAMSVLRSQMRKEAKEFLTIPQFRILANVSRGMKSIGEICQHHGVSQPAMSKMVDSLTQKGLLARTTDPDDRRCCVLALTPEGRCLFNKIKKRAYKRLDELAADAGAGRSNLVEALCELRRFIAKVDEAKAKEEG